MRLKIAVIDISSCGNCPFSTPSMGCMLLNKEECFPEVDAPDYQQQPFSKDCPLVESSDKLRKKLEEDFVIHDSMDYFCE